ncbi:hypothetical protein E1265_10950 [Streptomyces sp. 8K308]|nr:hypothetical protein E1265_10950 [Streptomyces sp. 8K308]
MGGRAGRVGAALVAVGCLAPVLAVIVGVVSLVVHYAVRTPTSPYQVVFSTPGTECGEGDAEDEELIIDRETGEVLYCGVLPPDRRRGEDAGQWGVLRRGGRPGHGGVDDARRGRWPGRRGTGQRGAVGRGIGRENGFDKTEQTLLERVTWRAGLYGVVGGLAALICLGLWAHYIEGPTGSR